VGQGNYRVFPVAASADDENPDGSSRERQGGLAVSLDQEFGEHLEVYYQVVINPYLYMRTGSR